jgi:hypothetical protein
LGLKGPHAARQSAWCGEAGRWPGGNVLSSPRRVSKTLDALGGLGSPAGGCVWHVVGMQRSIREWSMRQGWSGRPIGERQAHGILVAALGMLAGHYGYGARKFVDSRSGMP